jgi:hypothetical protein
MTLFAALVCSILGMAWLALAMDTHWRQVRSTQGPNRQTAILLRAVGSLALALSLILCLRTDHASMASLVWVMMLAGGALGVAFTLAWRPRLLAPLAAWVGGPR